jgi:GNAT superfamily N-acetyltransferase
MVSTGDSAREWLVQSATPDDLGRVARAFARSLVSEPMMRWPIGEVADPEGAVGSSCRIWDAANIELGVVFVAAAGAGAAVWVAPELAARWIAIERATRPAIYALSDDAGEKYRQMWDWVEARESAEPGWYLDRVGVDPVRQDEGIGTALIQFGVDQAARARLAAFLDTGTERNVSRYESLGFRVFDEGIAPGGGPQIWFMRSDPTG